MSTINLSVGKNVHPDGQVRVFQVLEGAVLKMSETLRILSKDADPSNIELPELSGDSVAYVIGYIMRHYEDEHPLPILELVNGRVPDKPIEYPKEEVAAADALTLGKGPEGLIAPILVPIGPFAKPPFLIEQLWDYAYAANHLAILPLVHILCQNAAKRAQGKTREEIFEIYQCQAVLTPEEEAQMEAEVRAENPWIEDNAGVRKFTEEEIRAAQEHHQRQMQQQQQPEGAPNDGGDDAHVDQVEPMDEGDDE